MKQTTPLQEVQSVNNIYPLDNNGECTCYDKRRTHGKYFFNGLKVCKHEFYKETRAVEAQILVNQREDISVQSIQNKLMKQNEVINDLRSENEAFKSQIRAFKNQVSLLQISLDPAIKEEKPPLRFQVLLQKNNYRLIQIDYIYTIYVLKDSIWKDLKSFDDLKNAKIEYYVLIGRDV